MIAEVVMVQTTPLTHNPSFFFFTGDLRTIVGCQLVWPSGKVLGCYAESLRFESASAVISLKKLWSELGHCLVTLSLTINEALKWLSSLPILMQKSF